ncbi:sperm acrosome-associated protein 9 isoform X4 [Camelus bactrianus]|uniref:Sperm acrosome-associated protein 9 isoform X4 n=1 Tax=Camelus bactrianus TaxID=9837 RepID=A0AC58Q8H3_CAMBA
MAPAVTIGPAAPPLLTSDLPTPPTPPPKPWEGPPRPSGAPDTHGGTSASGRSTVLSHKRPPRMTMNEVKESLRGVEQKYKLFQQQQFTFIAALEHCRENAHDKIRPISSIGQVQSYTEHYCNNSTDRRVLLMFLDICTELSKLCQRFEALHSGTPVTNNLLEKCKTLVSQSNDLSSLRAKITWGPWPPKPAEPPHLEPRALPGACTVLKPPKAGLKCSRYPHDVVNHLSCDEARNHYGGVVSLIPIVLDLMKEWVAHSEKLPRKELQHGAT